MTMARVYEIEIAFRESICFKSRTVKTCDFLEALRRYNWEWTPEQANRWIMQKGVFRDITLHNGDNREFKLFTSYGAY